MTDTLTQLWLRYDGPIPQHLRDAALRSVPMAAAAYRAMSPAERRQADIANLQAAITLDWRDIRRLCRNRDGVLPGLVEAARRYRETGDPYYLGRWRQCRRRLDKLLRVMSAHKNRLAHLRQPVIVQAAE